MARQTQTDPVAVAVAVRAAEEYLARKARRSHPAGSFDRKSRFTLAPEEQCSCCKSIRCPSARFPWSEMLHGRTMKHVAQLHQVALSDVRRAVKSLER